MPTKNAETIHALTIPEVHRQIAIHARAVRRSSNSAGPCTRPP